MREQVEQRLEALRNEFQAGQQQRADLDAQANTLRNTLLRISGAIQVLDEELGQTPPKNETSEKAETPIQALAE